MAKKKKLSRKEMLNEPDKFKVFMENFLETLKTEKEKVIRIIVIGILGVSLGLGLSYYLRSKICTKV